MVWGLSLVGLCLVGKNDPPPRYIVPIQIRPGTFRATKRIEQALRAMLCSARARVSVRVHGHVVTKGWNERLKVI